MQFSYLAIASFLAIPAVANVPAGAMQMKMKRSTGSSIEQLKKREVDANVQVNDDKVFFTTNIKVGSPPQEIEVVVDTASSDTLLYTPDTKYKGEAGDAPNSKFNPSQSNTFEEKPNTFEYEVDGGKATGKYASDNVAIGETTIKDMNIGLVDESPSQHNILGLGKPANGKGVLEQLYEAGEISSPSFSLNLGAEDEEGSLLLGAVDHSQYEGTLNKLEARSSGSHYGATLYGVSSDGLAKQNCMMSGPALAVFDSGSKLSYLPSADTRMLHEVLNANPSFAIGQKYYADCNITQHLNLDFGGSPISVPNYYFLTPIEEMVPGPVAATAFPRNSCYLGIEDAPSSYALLGENLLRGMYIVYDGSGKRDTLAVAAAAKERRSQSEIELITKEGGIPRAA